MRRRAVVLAAAIAATAAFWFVTSPTTISVAAVGAHKPDPANGRTMFYAGGCASCHATPGQDDKTKLGGGLALKSTFGTFYVPNISPDTTDGIGRWSQADFLTAMQEGTSPDGRHYYPAFPYTSYQHMRAEDVLDLFEYLKTLPAVQGRVRDHDVHFPFNIRRLLGAWKLLFLDRKHFQPDASKSAEWNRGAYLVNGPAHCAECHSPRNALGGIVAEQRFAGGPNPDGEGWVPNMTPKGLFGYSDNDLAYLLETGQTPDGDSVGGSMTPVIRNTSQLSAEDRNAIAAYVKSLPPIDDPKKPKAAAD